MTMTRHNKRFQTSIALLSLVIAISLGCRFITAPVASIFESVERIDDAKQRGAELNERSIQITRTISQTAHALGGLDTSNIADPFAADIVAIKTEFASAGLVAVTHAITHTPPFSEARFNARGNAEDLVNAFIALEGLHSKISAFSVGAVDPDRPDQGAQLNFTLVRYTGGDVK